MPKKPEYTKGYDAGYRAGFAKGRRLALRDRKVLDRVLTDPDYEGGVQFWIRRHDALMLRLAQIESGQAARTEAFSAVAKGVEGDNFTR